MYWGVNPLKNRLVQCCFSLFNQRGLCSPLGSDIHDQNYLSLELLEIVLLVAREFGLEVVEFGHSCPGEVWRGSEKLTVRLKVKMGRQRRWPNTAQQNRSNLSNHHNYGYCNHSAQAARDHTFWSRSRDAFDVIHLDSCSSSATTLWECLMANG